MKFAYLIMAHDNEKQLRLLLNSLDYHENDIYLHIDKKSDLKKLAFDVKNARIFVYHCFSVYWGDISQTKCQFFLLNEAKKEYHDYYHLLSGHDLPIKPHLAIMAFFKQNYGKQFIHFESDEFCMKDACRYYHFLAPLISRCNNFFLKDILNRLEKEIIIIQRKMNVKRTLFCGANWYSITHDFAEEFCSKKDDVLKKIRWTISSDEYVLQTFYRTMARGKYELFARTTKPEDYHGLTREIDWLRGTPYVWKNTDYEYLMKSERMFARKFDQKIDFEVIKKIVKTIKGDLRD